jgi:hypothetical protein
LLAGSMCFARPAQRPTTYDQMIAREAKIHGVPETFMRGLLRTASSPAPTLEPAPH